jgi:hypothetical protein
VATIQDAIKRLIYQFSSVGADQLVADQNKVADANANIAATSQTASTASLSLEKSFDSLERRYVTTVRAQQDFEAVQTKVNAAVAQNPALQERANVVLDAAKAKLEAASGSADLLSKITDKARESMAGFALEGGAVGGILGSFGPWGIAAAAAVGLVSAAFDYLNEHASKFGEASIGIKNFGQVSGITATQVRGLQEAAEKAGESGDSIATSFERFTVNLESARDGTGSLFDSIQKINPALAVQIASTKSSADAWDILAKATNSTTDATTRAALARAAFGKGGVADVPVLIATDNAGGLAAYSEEVQKATGITDQLTLHTAQLAVQIEATKKQTENIYASLYSDEVLSRQAKFAKAQLDIAQTIASYVRTAGGFKFSDLLPSESQPGLTTLEANAAAQAASAAASPKASSASESSDPSEKIKAQAEATQQLTAATTALGAAQANADKAQQSYGEQSVSLSATTKSLADSRKNAGDALLLLSNLEKQHIAALGGAATGEEILKARTDALTAAFDKGTISADDYQRALHGDTDNQLSSLNDQLAIVQAITGQEQQRAQYLATVNSLLQAGKNLEDATAIAAEKLAISQAAADAAVKRQVQSLQDSTDMIRAQQNGTEATTAAAIAYKNAIHTGASDTAASALSAATLANYAAKAAASTQQMAAAAQASADAYQRAANAAAEAAAGAKAASNGDFGAGSQYGAAGGYAAGGNVGSGATSGGSPTLGYILETGQYVPISEYNQYYSPSAQAQRSADRAVSKGDIPGAILGAEKHGDTSLVDTLTNLLNGFTKDPKAQSANLQAELAWLQTQPETIARDQQIQTLMQSIDQLTSSTNSLNSTNQDLLSPYYSQDPRTSHIGFRSQGMSDGGYVPVPGSPSANDNMIATIPVASGERIYVDPQNAARGKSSGGTSQSITINAPITINGVAANKDDIGRTVFQAVQSASRQLQAASR